MVRPNVEQRPPTGELKAHVAPDWTDWNEHDPGVTVLELLVYTAEALLVTLILLRWRAGRRKACGVVHA